MRTVSVIVSAATACMVAITFTVCVACGQSRPHLLQDFADRYQKAKTDNERLAVCITAMDTHLIYDGMPVAEIDQMFKTSFGENLAAMKSGTEKYRWEEIWLTPFVDDGKNIQQRSDRWRFVFQYDADGTVWSYHVTNVSWKHRLGVGWPIK